MRKANRYKYKPKCNHMKIIHRGRYSVPVLVVLIANPIQQTSKPTSVTTDQLGRMTKRIHPDAGETRYSYDNAGNLLTEVNPLGQINYDYTYYRVLKKRYYMTFSRLGIVQTLRDLPSALGLSKTL